MVSVELRQERKTKRRRKKLKSGVRTNGKQSRRPRLALLRRDGFSKTKKL